MSEHLEALVDRLERRVRALEDSAYLTDRRAREALDEVRRLEDRVRYLESARSY